MSGAPLTVGIATRNRPDELVRCLRSLHLLDGLLAEVIVLDDASDPPIEAPTRAALGAELPPSVRFIRSERSMYVSAARNLIAREAATPWVMNLDDDAFILDRAALEAAIRVLERDPEVAAVALAQADAQGRAYDPAAQPSPADHPCYVPTFIGYAHVLRRDAFLAAGGFRERLGINGEEKELSLRLLDAGYRVVYLPGARIAHVASAAERDARRYLHQTVRNTTLGALYDEPMPLVFGGVALRLAAYFPMRRGWKIHDPGGFGRIVRGLVKDLPAVLRERRPVRWSTIRRWRRLTRNAPEPYRGPGVEDG